ncbi:MAG TPA: DUF5686 family protein [Sphingobacteriaceae bacterium]|nr:DUF5686 family protein [Sphingobacteriaceae bacterium]
MRSLLLCCSLCMACIQVSAQYFLRGMVVDAETQVPLTGATVTVSGTSSKSVTDQEGWFTLNLTSMTFDDSLAMEGREVVLLVAALGYNDLEISARVSGKEVVPLEVRLNKEERILEEVIVSHRYSNRNPAVDLIRKVTAHRAANRMTSLSHVQFRAYNKIMMAVSDLPGAVAKNPLFRKYDFIFENTDTVSSPGRTLTPLYIEEKLSSEYRNHVSSVKRSTLLASQSTELDERFVNNENLQTVVSFLHADMDLYDNNLILFNRSFMSPVATGAQLFYKYAIRDTIKIDNRAYVRVDFLPRNEQERLFSGNLLISTEGRYAIREAFLQASQSANINWINDLEIHFQYERQASGLYLPSLVETQINFGIYGSRQGFFSRWVQHFDHYMGQSTQVPSLVADTTLVEVSRVDSARSGDYLQGSRPVPLSEVEEQLYRNIDSLNQNHSFIKTLEWVSFLATSYKRVGAVEFGPLEHAYTYNHLEGNRFRAGGRLSKGVSDRFFAEGYAAYGLLDERWKYYGLFAVSLNSRPIAQFPGHYLSISYQNDVREPGLPLDFLNGDSFFRSFGRNDQNRWLYHRLFKLQHSVEFGNQVRLRTTLASRYQETAGNLHFTKVAGGSQTPGIQTSEAVLEFRWAPNEEYFQSNLRRFPVSGRYPIIHFRYNAGLSGLFGGEYAYHALRFDVSKRVYLSFLGFTDLEFGTGYIFGSLPFPLLETPMADQSYLLSPDTYRLMNNLEFVSDQFAKFNIDHRFQGFFINKIPLLRRTKIRETIGAKVYFGRLRAENNPEHNPELFYFPVNRDGVQSSFSLGKKPYVEASVGLENIFNFLHIEYIKRLSYLHLPEAKKDGFRFSVRLGF